MHTYTCIACTQRNQLNVSQFTMLNSMEEQIIWQNYSHRLFQNVQQNSVKNRKTQHDHGISYHIPPKKNFRTFTQIAAAKIGHADQLKPFARNIIHTVIFIQFYFVELTYVVVSKSICVQIVVENLGKIKNNKQKQMYVFNVSNSVQQRLLLYKITNTVLFY
eukprot:EC095542.1.p2 GENE.EC095542.1~~EC095542.1.p2  ORF type:complete len:162 (-),score=4.08 EC095542.1:41-526(-)